MMQRISAYVVAYLALAVCFSTAQEYIPSGGPVYVNPAAQQAQAAAVQSSVANDAEALLTQTVYGFLDFTTTIGNTVMVFSPQSEPKAEPPKPPVTEVIETKPPSTLPPPAVPIKPSKILEKKSVEGGSKKAIPETKVAPVVSSVVKVIEAPVSSIVEIRQETAPVVSSVVEVRQEVPVVFSKVEIRQEPPVVFSKVEIRQEPPVVFSKVEVRQEAPVMFSKVEVREGNTQVFSSDEHQEEQPRILSSVVEIIGESSKVEEPPKIFSSVVQVVSGPEIVSSRVEVISNEPESSDVDLSGSDQHIDEPAIQGNNIIEPEYDFLSRQPSEVVDETYRVINLRPSSKFHLKPRSSPRTDENNPTGLVTRLGGTVVKDGVTTVHETKVIGTYISGKYAQVLQSSSKIKPSAVAKIQKTQGPNFGKGRFPHLEPTPAGSSYDETVALPLEALFSSAANANQIRGTKQSGGGQRNRFNLRNKVQDSKEQDLDSNEDEDYTEPPKKPFKPSRPAQSQRTNFRSTKGFSKSRVTPTTAELATVSVFTESSAAGGRRNFQNQRRSGGYRPQTPTTSSPESSASSRRFKPKFQASPVEHDRSSSTSLYKFKLARPQGRWQYKTTPKPRVTIRKSEEGLENVTLTSPSPSPQFNPEQRSELSERTDFIDENGEEYQGEVEEIKQVNAEYKEPIAVAETIKVEISTPADFKDVYYELATIRSPYTFQVGTVKNTRFITVTSTLEKSLVESTSDVINPSNTLNEPLTENILSTLAPHYTHTLPLDSSIATLPPIALASDMETPPLETLTETFSTTQLLLKTHILPVVRHGSDTSSYTLVQSYHVTRFVTAIKTLPPMEAYHFHPSRTLTDLNTRLEEAGSELHLELEFGDENDSDQPAALRALRPDIDLANIGSELDISDLDKLNLPDGPLRYKKTPEPLPRIASVPKVEQTTPQYSPEQLQQLALLRFLNPAAAASLPQFVTTSRPVIKLETVYESHVLPLFDGVSTLYSTLSRPIGTITKTEYELVTSAVPQQLPALPNINHLFPQQQQVQQQFQVTSSPVVTQTIVTETQSKVLKLTFGAKTQFTTIFSTKVVPTLLTTYVTASIPVQQQQQVFNPYFGQPYQQLPQFPYVG